MKKCIEEQTLCGAPKGGAPKEGRGPQTQKDGAPKGGGRKISRFLFPLPPPFHSFGVFLGLLVECGWCL